MEKDIKTIIDEIKERKEKKGKTYIKLAYEDVGKGINAECEASGDLDEILNTLAYGIASTIDDMLTQNGSDNESKARIESAFLSKLLIALSQAKKGVNYGKKEDVEDEEDEEDDE